MLLTLLQSSGAPPTNSIVWIKVAGVWKTTTPYIKVSGTWKTATPFIKITGIWK
jgi:hypothetical protein